jgi:hypothetical protein
LEDAYQKQETITSNEFIETLKYIPLETSPNCLIGANPKVYTTDKYFIIIDNQNHCYLFDKSNGKYIRQIGHYGKDPGGYRGARGFFNELTSTLYFSGWKENLIKYSLDGKEIGSVSIPGYNSDFTNTYMPDRFDYLGNNLIVCNIINTNGLQKTLLMIFDENGKEIKTIPNRNIGKEYRFTISIGDATFSHYQDKLLFNEMFNDTVFHIGLDKVVPYLIINRGKLRSTREDRASDNIKILSVNLFESNNFIVASFWTKEYNDNIALYDKTNSKLKVVNLASGFKNNTDGFVTFIPKSIVKEELIGIIQQQDILKWADNNKVMKDKLSKELIELTLKDPTDNPTIVIAKLK